MRAVLSRWQTVRRTRIDRRCVCAANELFITYSKQPHLDGRYTIIGKVIDGAEPGGTLEAMELVPVDAKNRPVDEIRTERVTIHANPIAQKMIH